MGPHPRPFLGVGQVEPLWLHVENGLGQRCRQGDS